MKSDVRSPQSAVRRALVCFALQEEAGAFAKLVAARPELSILVTGIGQKNATTALAARLQDESPQLVLTCGFAGALNPALLIGDVVFSCASAAFRDQLVAAGAKPAKFFCALRIATTAAEKAELRHTTGADAVEMESAAIHIFCQERGIPCATVRAISDIANEDLPLDFNALAKPDLSLDYGKLGWAVAKSPRKIPALLRLQKHSSRAAEQLAQVLGKVLADFHGVP